MISIVVWLDKDASRQSIRLFSYESAAPKRFSVQRLTLKLLCTAGHALRTYKLPSYTHHSLSGRET